MNDFSVWDLASDFSGRDAAALIVGEKPPGDSGNWRPVIDRMMRSYQVALNWHTSEVVCDPDHCETRPAEMLESIEMILEANRDDIDDARGPHVFHSWLSDSRRSGFGVQRFKRAEIARWLDAIGHKPVYQFAGKGPGVDVSGSEKPLGTRERDTLLTIIAVLCDEAKIPRNKTAKAAALIQGMAAKMGVSIGETTIEVHLKKLPDALAARMK